MKAPGLREVLRALPAPCRPLVEAVLGVAREKDTDVFLVGGPVRDLLLGRAVRDVDLLVQPDGHGGAAELAAAAAAPGDEVRPHGAFGTVSLRRDGALLDLATTRSETYAHPGALPRVQPGTLEEDLRRRDFGVNALALPLSASARRAGRGIVDAVGGLADLERGVLRVLHKASFHDDPTRALRAARLSARLGFPVSRSSRNALRDALRDGAFARVSGERFLRELERLFEEALQGGDPAAALARLHDWHVLAALEPGLDLPRVARSPLRRLGRGLAEPPWSAPRLQALGAGLAVWLAPHAAALRRRTLERLAVRGERARRIAAFPRERDGWLRSLSRARGRGAVDAALHGVDDERLLALWAWAPAPLGRRIARYAREDRPRREPISGGDLVGIGLEGPAVGRAQRQLRAAWLDGSVRNREEALALAREIADRASRGHARARSR